MPSVDEARVAFLTACRANSLSGETIKWYRYVLGPLVDRFGYNDLDSITPAHLRGYLADMTSQTSRYQGAVQRHEIPGKLSSETIRGRIRALRRFFSWCASEYGTDNPMVGIRPPARKRQQPKAIDPADLVRLLQSCDDTPTGRRDQALIAFLADTGCRAAGALTLAPSGLYLEQGRAVIVEKGDRTRAVPFTVYTARLLRAWLAVRPPQASTVFCSMGTWSEGDPLTVSGLNQLIKRLAAKAGVKGRCNPHSFRHGFARTYLQNGGDLATLSRLMGHSDVSVTAAFYAVFTDGELARRHEQFSPLRNLGGAEGRDQRAGLEDSTGDDDRAVQTD